MEALRNIKFEKGHDKVIDKAPTAEAGNSAMEQDTQIESEIAAIEREIGEEYIEEEIMVFADFENYVPAEDLADPNVRVKVIGIDTESPVIQINDDTYRGTYDFAMGTYVFLEEDELAKSKLDPLYSPDPPKMYKYSSQGNKVLKMKRIFATPKTDVVTVKTEPGTEAIEEATPLENERYVVTRSYEEALNLHLPVGCFPPRHINTEQNCEQIVQRKPVALTRIESDVEDDAMRDDPRDADYVPGMES